MAGYRTSAVVLAAVITVCMMAGGCAGSREDGPMGDRILNSGRVVRDIRGALKQHAKTITIRFDYGSDIFGELNDVVDAFMEEAMAETGEADEGDYIRYQTGGYTYRSSYTIENRRWKYTVVITPEYYCSLREEQAAEEEAERLLKELQLWKEPEAARRVRKIYSYICENVKYDRPHRKHPYYHRRSTAYAALIMGTATCQGYCAAMYRLLTGSGISCRIVTGTAEGEGLHAWLIAEIDGKWYMLDPTWDAGETEYRYCLVGTEHFEDHEPGDAFRTPEFQERYPLAEHDF